MSGTSSSTSLGFQLPNLSSQATSFIDKYDPFNIYNVTKGQAPSTTSLESPDALSSTPTVAQANTTAIQKELASEAAAATYGTQLSTGAGFLNPSTSASRILLGA